MAGHRGAGVVHLCKHCKEERPMKPFSVGMNGKIIWLRCGGCNKSSFMRMDDYQRAVLARQAPRVVVDGECVKYHPSKNFIVGQHLYHPVWDDSGEVLRKLTTGDGENTIVVAFSRLGERTLVEARSS